MELNQDTLEQAIIRDLAKEFELSFHEEMDYWLDLMYWKEQGWIYVKLSTLQDNRHAVDITYWLDENRLIDRVNYYRDGREFVFRDPKIATLFILRWS